MIALLRNRISTVWTLLIAATLASWWIGSGHGMDDPRVAGVTILAVAFVKVRFVGLYFMELRAAPVALGVIFQVWVLAVCVAVAAIYLSGG